ncbi:LysM domain-containing protein [Paraphaeosphaeria sporulosa]
MKVTSSVVFWLLASAAALSVKKRQDGPVDPNTDPDCDWYDTPKSESDTCEFLEGFWGVSHAEFVAWNPSIKDDCSGLTIGHSYCVEVARKPTTTSSSSVAPSPTNTPKPSPVQDGVIDTCTTWYFAIVNDDCTKIARKFGTFSVAVFIKWNPAVGSDCKSLWTETYYCVGIPGTPTAPISSSTVQPSSTNVGTSKPSPTQDGLIESCQTFYFAAKDETCATIVKKYGTFSVKEFITWNPAVGEDCRALWAETYYCVGIPGTPTAPPPTSTLSPPSTPGNGISTPLPTQPSMVSNCDAFYFVPKNEGCQAVADKNGITLAQFLQWNPQAGSNCAGLWAEAYACVSIIGHTPSKSSSTIKTSATPTPTGCTVAHPEPTQPDSLCKCKQWYLPAKNEYCADIEKKFGISATQFRVTWNPSIGTSCGGMWAGTYVCVKA